MRLLYWIIFGVLILAFASLWLFNLVAKPMLIEKFMSGGSPPVMTVSAAPAESVTWQPLLSAIGTLDAEYGTTVTAEVGGIVSKIAFSSGEEVEAGQLLLQLDDSVERAQLASLRAELKNAELALSRAKELNSRGNTSQAALDKAQADSDELQAQVTRQLAVMNQKAIKAPFTGRIGIRRVNLGEYVAPGTGIASLQSLNPIYANFPLPERDYSKISVGQEVEITVDAFPDRKFSGVVTSIDSEISANTRSVLVQATLSNADHLLIPGMFANVRLRLPVRENVVAIPETSIAYSLYGDTVYVLVDAPPEAKGAEKIAQRRVVRVGQAQDGYVEILEGVEDGELVATTGQHKLREGAFVAIGENMLTPRPKLPKE